MRPERDGVGWVSSIRTSTEIDTGKSPFAPPHFNDMRPNMWTCPDPHCACYAFQGSTGLGEF